MVGGQGLEVPLQLQSEIFPDLPLVKFFSDVFVPPGNNFLKRRL